MTTPEYTKLRNGLLIAGLPILAAIIFQAFSIYFTMQSKIDRTEYQKDMYELQLLMERKTMALEKIATNNEKTNIQLFNDIDKINERIDKMWERQNRLRSVVDN